MCARIRNGPGGVATTPRGPAHSLKEDCGHHESSAPSAPRSPRRRNPRTRYLLRMRHDHQDAHGSPPQRGACLQGPDVLPVVQPTLFHPGGPMVLLGEDGQPIDHLNKIRGPLRPPILPRLDNYIHRAAQRWSSRKPRASFYARAYQSAWS